MMSVIGLFALSGISGCVSKGEIATRMHEARNAKQEALYKIPEPERPIFLCDKLDEYSFFLGKEMALNGLLY